MADRVVGLCKFCEVHGPRIVFVCQERSAPNNRNGQKNWWRGGKHFYGDVKLDLGAFSTPATTSNDDSVPSTTSDDCDGCRAFETSKPVYLTNDFQKRVGFITRQYPFGLDLFSRVRCACVRSLSCEACPGREGPIIFGDAASGYCLCYVFTLKDSKARGFRHSYSIVIVSCSIEELISNYSSLVASLKSVVTTLQSWTECVFEREGAESSDRLPQIAASGRASWVPSGFFLRSPGGGGTRRLIASPRSLTELTDRKDVFKFLHKTFVDLHRLAAFSQTHGLRNIDPAYSLTEQDDLSVTDDSETTPLKGKNGMQCHTCKLFETGPSSSATAFKTLTLLYDALGSEAFSMLAYHLLIGNQVVVRSSCRSLNGLLLDALKLLLPAGCIKCIDSCGYREPWECNLVGLVVDNGSSNHAQDGSEESSDRGSVSRKISQRLQNLSTEEGCVILCVETPEGLLNSPGPYYKNGNVDYSDFWTTKPSLERDPIRNLQMANSKFRMFCASPTASGSFFDIELPGLLQNLLNLFSKLDRSEEGAAIGLSIIESMKDEWMRKAKLYYVMSRTSIGGDGTEWRKTFLRISKCGTTDEHVLRFWRSGLHRQFKQNVLSHCASRYQQKLH